MQQYYISRLFCFCLCVCPRLVSVIYSLANLYADVVRRLNNGQHCPTTRGPPIPSPAPPLLYLFMHAYASMANPIFPVL